MEIKISDKTDTSDVLKISRMLFDGKRLTIYSMHRDHVLARYPEISGLPPKSKRLARLIEEGRKDLKIDTDYTKPSYQKVKDAGPIPAGNYRLRLKTNMPYDKSKAAGDPPGWGKAVGSCRRPSSPDSTIGGAEGSIFFCIMTVVIPAREAVSV